MMVNLSNEKKRWRGLLKNRLSSLSLERRRQAKCSLHLQFTSAVLSFHNTPLEIDLLGLNQKLAEKGILHLPKIQGDELLIYRVEDIESQVALHPLGFGEPIISRCEAVNPMIIKHILVPGLGFDSRKNRLGYGKGYYDRLLKKMIHAETIGIGFKEQFVHDLPIEGHDVKVKKTFLI